MLRRFVRNCSARSPFRLLQTFAGGALLLAGTAGAHASDAMTFESVGAGSVNAVSATGSITEQTPQAFAAYLREGSHGTQPLTVYIDSPGGVVLSSMELGQLMRKAHVTVVVGKANAGFFSGPNVDAGECYSACVYALMGGSRRVIPPNSQVGIHRMFLAIDGMGDVTKFVEGKARSAANPVRGALTAYTSRMGVSPDLISRAEQSSDFHVLSQAEIRKWRLGVPN
jgi:hypothetical protein